MSQFDITVDIKPFSASQRIIELLVCGSSMVPDVWHERQVYFSQGKEMDCHRQLDWLSDVSGVTVVWLPCLWHVFCVVYNLGLRPLTERTVRSTAIAAMTSVHGSGGAKSNQPFLFVKTIQINRGSLSSFMKNKHLFV